MALILSLKEKTNMVHIIFIIIFNLFNIFLVGHIELRDVKIIGIMICFSCTVCNNRAFDVGCCRWTLIVHALLNAGSNVQNVFDKLIL